MVFPGKSVPRCDCASILLFDFFVAYSMGLRTSKERSLSLRCNFLPNLLGAGDGSRGAGAVFKGYPQSSDEWRDSVECVLVDDDIVASDLRWP